MEVSQIELALFCFVALVGGFLFGVVYDVFSAFVTEDTADTRIRSKLCSTKLPIVGCIGKPGKKTNSRLSGLLLLLYDFGSMIAVGIAVSVLTYRFNDGKWRVGILALLIVGFVLYRKLFRKAVVAIIEVLRFFIRCVLSYVVFLTVKPVKHCAVIAYRSARGVTYRAMERFNEKEIKKYSDKEKINMLRNAAIFGAVGRKKGDNNDRFKNKKQSNNLDNDSFADRYCNSCDGEFNATQPKQT